MPSISANRRRLVTVLFLAILLLISLGVFFYWKQASYSEIKVIRGNLKIQVASSGKIRAEKEANLEYNSAGWITELPVKENELVKKDQVVAKIDPTEASKNVTAAEATYRSAQAALDKVISDIHLFQYGNGGYGNVGTANETQAQKTARQQAEEAVNIAYDNLQKAQYATTRTVIKSPFDGVVTKVNAELNEATSMLSSQPIIQIVDFSTLYFEAEIDQEKSGLIRIGQQAVVTLDAKKDTPLYGSVYEIGNSVKTTAEGDEIVPVKLQLPNAGNLIMGWEGDVQIELENKSNVLLLPKNAVEYVDGKSVIRQKKGLLTTTKPVQLGSFDGTNWEVIDGISENDLVIVRR